MQPIRVETNHKPRNLKIFHAIKERTAIGRILNLQQEYPKQIMIKEEVKSVHSGYRDRSRFMVSKFLLSMLRFG